MTPLEEEKLMTVLQFYLSLHEAYDIYDAIFDDKTSSEQIEQLLEKYRDEQKET